jgi:hypothetical protein
VYIHLSNVLSFYACMVYLISCMARHLSNVLSFYSFMVYLISNILYRDRDRDLRGSRGIGGTSSGKPSSLWRCKVVYVLGGHQTHTQSSTHPTHPQTLPPHTLRPQTALLPSVHSPIPTKNLSSDMGFFNLSSFHDKYDRHTG